MSAESAAKRFFIALLPPPELQATANTIKQYFSDRYQSRAAQKSPPHITLQPPFTWPLATLPELTLALATFAQKQPPVPVTLDGFAAFPPRVIFMNVHKTPALLTLQQALTDYLETVLGIVDPKSKRRPFTPHLTVAFRDLTKRNFQLAWPEFQDRAEYHEFLADRLTLLIHDGQRWQIAQEFPFLSQLEEQA